jgi:hypothetical protein
MSTISIVFFAPFVMKRRFDAASTAEISAPARPAPVLYRPTNFNSEPFGGIVSAAAEEVCTAPATRANKVNMTDVVMRLVFIASQSTLLRLRQGADLVNAKLTLYEISDCK